MHKTHLELIFAVGIRISPDLRQYLDGAGLRGTVRQREGHLSVSEGLSGVRTEGELSAEHRLALQTSALTYEQMVVVALEKEFGLNFTISDIFLRDVTVSG